MKKQNKAIVCVCLMILTGFILIGCQSTTVAVGNFDENLIGRWTATEGDDSFELVVRPNKTATLFLYDKDKNLVNQGVVKITDNGRSMIFPSGTKTSFKLNGGQLALISSDGSLDNLNFTKVEQ